MAVVVEAGRAGLNGYEQRFERLRVVQALRTF
jgi:hypothetical protein